MKCSMTFGSAMLLVLYVTFHSTESLAKKKAKEAEEPAAKPAPEMRIDPNLIQSYQKSASVESERVETSGVQILAVEPAIDLHQFQSLYAQNEYFEVPLSGGSKSTMSPSVWVGHPTGSVWFKIIRVRAGLDLSYLGYDGAQTVHQRSLNQDFRDNISAHVFPIIASARLGSATSNESIFGVSPWVTVGTGMMLTQVSGSLDGASQSAWTPISKVGAGLRYSMAGKNAFFGGVSAGVFRISGSSKKAKWLGSGVTMGADVYL